MSKREIRAKRLVAAVLLAISVQMWSAPPLWAAEASVQTETSAAGEAKETKDAKAADSETGGEADAEEEETVVVPVIGYSTRSAAGSDYGVMPLADTAVDGALTGVTSINGSELVIDKVNNNFFIGTIDGGFDKNSKNNAAIGLGISVDSTGNNSVFGIEAIGWGESASVFGYNAVADDFSSSFGAGAKSEDCNGSAFGYNAEAWGGSGNSAFGYNAKAISGGYGVAVGTEAKVESWGGIAIGGFTKVEDTDGLFMGGIAIGLEAHTNNERSIAIGYDAESTLKNSIAIGAESNTTAENQVSFGKGVINTINGEKVIEWTARRSLAGISDIDMAGALTGLNKIDMKNGALTGVSTINGNVLVAMNEDVTNKSLAIGTGAVFSSSSATIYKNAIAIGNGAYAGGNGSLAIGFDSDGNASAADGVGSISLNARASGDHNVIISGWADAYDSVVIGYGAGTDNSNVVAIGNGSYGGGNGTTLGYAAGTEGYNSVAIGAKSFVASGDDNKVSFGHKVGDRNYADGNDYSDDMFRSLINVADVDMHGALTGVTGIDGVTVSGTDASTGLTVGGNAVIGKTDTPFSSTGFAVAKDGAVTAKTVNGATITGTGFNGVTLSTDGKVNGAAITSNSFNGVKLEKGADSHYKVGGVDVTKMQTDVAGKADAATTLTGYGITDAYTKTETDTAVGKKADKATTLTGYGIADAYTKTETDTAIGKKADKATTLTGYGIADAYTKTETDTAIGKKADKATTLIGYGITDAYTKTAADEKITAATADMATKTQVTADIGTAKTALESAYQAADTALSNRAAALETAATGMSYDAGKNTTTFTGGVTATVLTAGEFKVGATGFGFGNDGALTAKTVNGIEIKKDESKVMVGGIDLTALSNGDVVTDNTKGIDRNQDTATTTIETNTKISSSGITTNKATVSGATATTLENGKLTVGAATVQNIGFAVGSSSLNNGSLTVDGNNKLTTAGLTASKVTIGAVIVSGGKVSGLTDAALSAVSTEAVTGKQLNATNTTVSALDTAYKAADTQIRTDFAAADTTLQNNIDTKVAQTAYDTKMSALDSADTALGSRATALETVVNDSTTGLAAVNTKVGALDTAYKAADNALSGRATALETATTGMTYAADKTTTTFAGGVTAAVLTAGELKVGATGFGFGSDGALTAKTVNGIEIKKDESKVMVGGIDLTALSNGDVVTDNTKGIGRNQDTATTTIETNTAISSSGITTNAVTASGTVKAGEFVEGSQKLSDKYAAKTALADYTTTTDMNTKFADYATTTAVDTKLADYAKSDSVYSKAAADTAFAKAGDVDTLKTTVGDADGGLVKDVTELQSGKADKATTLAGYGIADAYTQTEINEKIVEATKDLATSATVTDIQSGLEEVTGKTAGLSYDTASGSSKFSGSVVIGNEGAKTHTQITDDAIIFGEGTDKQVTVDASGIHVGKKAAGGIALYADADGTHIDHTSLVTGSVTADNLNGVAISGNATDGLSVGGVSIKALSERLDSLEQDGVATADMGGIKRTDVVENSGKTIIEDTTSFTKDGLKTANLEAATAALGGVNFAAGAVTGVSSINGVVFGSDGKIGGVSLSGGKVDGVDVGWLDQRVKSLEDNGTGGGGTGGGGSSANTSGIHKPDGDTTNIEGNTSITTDGIDTNKVNASDSIVVADGETNKTVISKDGILVAEGEKNQVKINEDGIHVGKNSSVVNDTDGFITDKGLYIGVSSSSDTSTAKFSVAPNGNLSSKAGDYGFSNTSADGAKFTHSGDTAYGTGSQLDTTIQGNKVTTGRVDTDELYVDGNKVTVAGGTIGQTDAVDNHLEGTDADGNTVTNDFKTSAVNGTTQAAEKTSADGKGSTKTVNNTSAGGTSVTTSKTTTDSKDNVTVKESSFGTNEKGMTLSTGTKVTDKDGKVTKNTSGETKMTGDSISVSKTTTTTEKDADGNEKEVTKTSGTTIGSGEVTLKREDGSTIEVGSAIEGMQSDMRELDGRVNRMGVEIKEVGALSAALAGLHPQPENANSRADFAMAMGSYEGKQALAVGGFYRPDKRTMLSIGASTTSSKHMMNMGISIALDRLPEAERKAKEAAKAAGVEQETLNRVLERLAALEQDNRRLQADNEKRDVAYEKLAADYTQLKEKYIEETADRQQPEQAEAEE